MVIVFCWIKVPSQRSGGVVDKLKEIKEVVEAGAVYGPYDVIAKIVAPDMQTIDEIIMDKIQSLESVELTRTYVVVESMYWERK